MAWHLQQINTNSPANVSDPVFVSVYNGQQHVGYRDAAGNIWDPFYRPDINNWNLQRINNGHCTNGPPAVNGPYIGVYGNQQHFAYIDNSGNVWDSFFDGNEQRWHLQKINNGGCTYGPAALLGSYKNPVSIMNVTNTQQHFIYVGADRAIYDAFFDSNSNSWHLQKIDLGGPAAGSGPFGCAYHQQQHIRYRDDAGNLWDSWFDGNTGRWNLQKINNGGMTKGPGVHPGTKPMTIWVDPATPSSTLHT
jgi:hypothetical protein